MLKLAFARMLNPRCARASHCPQVGTLLTVNAEVASCTVCKTLAPDFTTRARAKRCRLELLRARQRALEPAPPAPPRCATCVAMQPLALLRQPAKSIGRGRAKGYCKLIKKGRRRGEPADKKYKEAVTGRSARTDTKSLSCLEPHGRRPHQCADDRDGVSSQNWPSRTCACASRRDCSRPGE